MPYLPAAKKFAPKRRAANSRIHTKVGMDGMIFFIMIADATICVVIVIAPPSQLTQPMVNPMAGLINSVQ